MLKKRIIPCLDIKDGRTVKGVNFLSLRDAGDPVELAQRYVEEGADELVFLDITATVENRKTLIELVKSIAKAINIPFTVGGGIQSVEDAVALIEAGADKVAINSAAINQPQLITDIANRLGAQCVVVAIDVKLDSGLWTVYKNGGRISTGLKAIEWAREVERLGAGEILLTSMNADGTKDGFELSITQFISNEVNIPVIASGGAGTIDDFIQVFSRTKASGALAASIFHYSEIEINLLKEVLSNNEIPVRWKSTLIKEMV